LEAGKEGGKRGRGYGEGKGKKRRRDGKIRVGGKGGGHEVIEGDSGLEELDEGHEAEDEECWEGAAGLEDPDCAEEFVSYGASCRWWWC
jgi:hypothetical protein